MKTRTLGALGIAITVAGALVLFSGATPAAETATAASASPAAASVAEVSAGDLAGIDISYPQCDTLSHVPLTSAPPFAVVGLNYGTAGTKNPCFQSEYNSALLLSASADQPDASVYVNTGDPGLAAKWWPSGDHTESGGRVSNPNGRCAHEAGAACAYVYGYSMAQTDVRDLRGEASRMPAEWWLDVETTNTWQYDDVGANAAALSGMVDYFRSRGLRVGIYSTSLQWKKIAGVTPASSSLAGLDSWLAGASIFSAISACERPALTPGSRVAMVQYVTDLDHDVACHTFADPSAEISPIAATTVGSVLTANPRDWGAGVAFSYQWQRDGIPISGATGRRYTTTKADVAMDLTVAITGATPGYSTTTVVSGAATVWPATTAGANKNGGRPQPIAIL